ncbi:MAG: tetratricopeptide repeat protein [Thermoguttaceae bacterium]
MSTIESVLNSEPTFSVPPFVFERSLNPVHLPIPAQTLRAESRFQEGRQLQNRGMKSESRECFADAVALAPSRWDYLLALAQTEYDLGRLEESAICFKELTHLQPENPSFWLTLGYIHVQLEHFASAISPLSTAVALDSRSPDALFLLAESLRKTGQFEESLTFYEKLLPIGLERPHAVYGYALSLFALDRLDTAWEAFEFRRISQLGTWTEHQLLDWNGISSPEKNVLVYSEEGLCADVMFASCLQDLIDSVGNCTVQCHPHLHSLFARSFPKARFISGSEPFESKETDLFAETVQEENEPVWEQVAFGSLPRFFRKNRESFAQHKPYLVADESLQKKWHDVLRRKTGSCKAGILWEGNWTPETKEQRTIPNDLLRTLLVAGKRQGWDWISLQQGSSSQKVSEVRSSWGIEMDEFSKELRTGGLDNWAALICSLDLVITPPGFVAHLAGALGVRTLLVLPTPCDWRWTIRGGVSEHKTPWYPNTVLCPQDSDSSWGTALGVIAREMGN